ncbi:MAG: substrate-binding domain-containing protein [Verrucomicrobiia bacterium]
MAPTGRALLTRRKAHGWSQADLAQRANISRTAVSAIEGERLTPSVTAALSLAAALGCSVEELFGGRNAPVAPRQEWAWTPRSEPCRYWEAEVNQRRLLYPVEALSLNPIPDDGLFVGGISRPRLRPAVETTLTVACCDPAAGLMAEEYARACGFRLLLFPRSGAAALELLRKGLVHVAGLHRSTPECPERNAETVRAQLGEGYNLLRAARWEEGVALATGSAARSLASAARTSRRWAAREPGSAARECLEELVGGRRFSGREVSGHAAVAETVRSGWADAGICVKLCAEEAGLTFLPVRKEALDLCFSNTLQHDRRIQALIRLLRSGSHRRLVSELPGYDARETGELTMVSV